jgi:glutathione S-transferase
MIKLYARTGSGSAAVEALLAELSVPFELIDVPRNPDKTMPDSFTAINPRGEVPALGLADGSIMTESAAMMIYLADLFPEKGLAPSATHPLRAQYLRWMVYIAAAIYNSDLRMYYPHRYSTDAAHADQIKAKAIIDLNRDFDVLAQGLGQGPYLLGETFSAADIYAAMIITWSEDMAGLLTRHGNLKRLYALVGARAAIRPAWLRNEMPT